MKAARTVWSKGKDGNFIKVLPIAIKGMPIRQETRPMEAWWIGMPFTSCKATFVQGLVSLIPSVAFNMAIYADFILQVLRRKKHFY